MKFTRNVDIKPAVPRDKRDGYHRRLEIGDKNYVLCVDFTVEEWRQLVRAVNEDQKDALD